MKSRIVLLLIGLSVLWATMIGRAAYLQLIPDARLKSLQKRQFETVVKLNPRRGDVVDRNGHELAVSMTSYSLFADPKIIEDSKQVVRLLSRELKTPAKVIEEKIKNRKKRFVWIQRHIDKNVHDAIVAEKIRGLGFVEESKRIYPNDRLLSQVLGFVGREETGLEGLELRYNDNLEAAKRQVSIRKDARGRPLIVNGQIFNQVPDGADVQLTIDRELQFILEQELAGAVAKHEADSAYGVVLDAQTSEIVAMASNPSFDPNKPVEFSVDRKRNRTVTDSYEPGSTMKTFVIAGALDKGIVQPNTKIDCENGLMKVGKRVIREADSKHKFNILTVSDILAVSSNVGTAKIAFKMGPRKVEESLRAFGFGQKSGVDLPGEAKGIVQPQPWRDHLLANISFGHGLATTPLQIANAYAVIANGGWLKQPYIVKAIKDHEAGEVLDTRPKIARRVLTDESVAKMRAMLVGVTSDEGTGINARVPGYLVAGKTGTAQKVDPNGRGYLSGGYISSFAGFIPANDPKYVIYIAVDHPRKEYYGGAVAAPVFSRVAGFAVRRAGIAPVSGGVMISQKPLAAKKNDLDRVTPLDDEKAPADASIVKNVEASKNNLGAGEVISSEMSSSDASVKGLKTKTPRVLAERSSQSLALSGASNGAPIGEEIPDLSGLTLREVLSRVTGTGIKVKFHGQGYVTHTFPANGARVSDTKELAVFLSR